MRERKYRAWNTETKKMIDLHSVTPLALDPALVSLGAQGVYLPFEPYLIIMDYTGLKDKNEREIYEGDIIRLEETAIGVIVYDEAQFLIKEQETVYRGLSTYVWGLNNFAQSAIEVIGNRYEHPNLLGDQQQ